LNCKVLSLINSYRTRFLIYFYFW